MSSLDVVDQSKQVLVELLNTGLTRPGRTKKGLARLLKIDPTMVGRMVRGDRDIKMHEWPIIREYIANGDGADMLDGKLLRILLIAGIDGDNNDPIEVAVLADDERYHGQPRHAFRLTDDSFNRVIPNGAGVVYVPYFKTPKGVGVRDDLREGDIVVVRTARWTGRVNHSVTMVRRVTRTPKGLVLAPESTRRYPSIRFPTGPGDTVNIIGLVISVVTDV
jgi:hypothetical protein